MNAILAFTLLSGAPGQAPPADRLPMQAEADVVSATVRIINQKKNSIGNGVVIARTGTVAFVLTAGHIVEQAEEVDVRVYGPAADAKPVVHAAVKVLARRTQNNQDLALVRVTGYSGKSDGLPLCPKDSVPKENHFAAFAAACRDGKNALVRPVTIEKSVQVTKPGAPLPARFWSSAKKVQAGDSGGPLVNARGELLGICSGAQSEHGYFCHLDEIRTFVRDAGLSFVLEKKP